MAAERDGAGTAGLRRARVETDAAMLALPVHAVVRGTGIAVVAVRITLAGGPRQGRGRGWGPTGSNARGERGPALFHPGGRGCRTGLEAHALGGAIAAPV